CVLLILDTICPQKTGVNPFVETVSISHTCGSINFLLKPALLFQNLRWLAKRRRALLESNSPRNNQLETHRNRWSKEERSAGRSSLLRQCGGAFHWHHRVDSP